MAENDEIKREEMTFSEQIIFAAFKTGKYADMLKLPKKRFTKFVIILMLVLGIVTFAIPTGAIIVGFGGFENLFMKVMPDITVENGELKIEKPFNLSFNNCNILIDTSEPTPTDEMLTKDGAYIAIGSQNARFAVVADGTVMDYRIFDLRGLFPEGFDNQQLTALITPIYISLFFSFLSGCVGFFLKHSFYAAMLMIVFAAKKKRENVNISNGDMFRLCFYGQTFAMIFGNFNAALGYLIPYSIATFVTLLVTFNMVAGALYKMGDNYRPEM